MTALIKTLLLRIIFIIAIYIFCYESVYAQQRPYYTQYILNPYILNPAVAGMESYRELKLGQRLQWAGLDGAPVTSYITFQGPLKIPSYKTTSPLSFSPSGLDPRGEAYWQDATIPVSHHALGGAVIYDRTGPLANLNAYATYAYHLGIAPQTTLAFGASFGLQYLSLNYGQLNFEVPNVTQNVSNYLNRIAPDANVGLMLYSRRYFVGVSAQNLFPTNVQFISNQVSAYRGNYLVPHFFVMGGYRVYLGNDFAFLPSTLIKYISPLPISFDLNAKFQYRDLAWAGLTYRYPGTFAGSVGININHLVNIGYSYDASTSPLLGTVNSGTHELVLGFLINNRYGDWCPKNIW